MESLVDIKRILFATDFSLYPSKAREHALTLDRKLDATVTVMHVIELVYAIGPEDQEMNKWYLDLEKELKAKLNKELPLFREKGVEVTGKIVLGTPWEDLVNYAEKMGMDLVIIGSHGARTRKGRLQLGTTSHKVALASRTPVLVVKADHESRSRLLSAQRAAAK